MYARKRRRKRSEKRRKVGGPDGAGGDGGERARGVGGGVKDLLVVEGEHGLREAALVVGRDGGPREAARAHGAERVAVAPQQAQRRAQAHARDARQVVAPRQHARLPQLLHGCMCACMYVIAESNKREWEGVCVCMWEACHKRRERSRESR